MVESTGTGPEGSWAVHTVDGAAVRLRSGKVGLFTVDVTAPVSGGELVITESTAHLALRLDLGELRTGNFLLQAAARSLVSRHDAGLLVYDGRGTASGTSATVSGHAAAGDVDLVIDLTVTAIGPTGEPMAEVELTGSANVGTVTIPLPGLGRVDDFSFDVDARLALRPRP